uniref:Uncharacterized protein n=1 Tax=Arundo donax TaxID=35708 RepID=A0A0A9GNB7_ARUDO
MIWPTFFHENYHLQKTQRHCSLNLNLYQNEELIQAMLKYEVKKLKGCTVNPYYLTLESICCDFLGNYMTAEGARESGISISIN